MDRDECFKFWGQKVKVQGHGGITYAGTVTAQVEAYSTRRLVLSYSAKWTKWMAEIMRSFDVCLFVCARVCVYAQRPVMGVKC